MGVFTECQGGMTSAVVSDKQLLLPISLVKVIRLFPKHFKLITLQWKILFTGGKHPRQSPVFPGVDMPVNSPQGQTATLGNYKARQELHLRLS